MYVSKMVKKNKPSINLRLTFAVFFGGLGVVFGAGIYALLLGKVIFGMEITLESFFPQAIPIFVGIGFIIGGIIGYILSGIPSFFD